MITRRTTLAGAGAVALAIATPFGALATPVEDDLDIAFKKYFPLHTITNAVNDSLALYENLDPGSPLLQGHRGVRVAKWQAAPSTFGMVGDEVKALWRSDIALKAKKKFGSVLQEDGTRLLPVMALEVLRRFPLEFSRQVHDQKLHQAFVTLTPPHLRA